jgi:hypothetical protein
MYQKELITMDSASDRGGGLPQLWHTRERENSPCIIKYELEFLFQNMNITHEKNKNAAPN